MSIEKRIISTIQQKFFTENHTYLDYFGKIISSRKYRYFYLYGLVAYFTILYVKDRIDLLYLVYKLVSILNIYIMGYLSRKVNIIIKLYFKRKRPFVKFNNILVNDKTRLKKENTFSFPSNSIQTSLIFYNVFIDVINFKKYKNIILLLIIIIISLSKINRGLHYPSDIMFSVLIFTFINWIYYLCIEVTEFFYYPRCQD